MKDEKDKKQEDTKDTKEKILSIVFILSILSNIPTDSGQESRLILNLHLNLQDEKGQPLSNVKVRIESAAGTSLATATSSSDGTASVPRLPRGRHRVIVSDARGDIGVAVLRGRVIDHRADHAHD